MNDTAQPIASLNTPHTEEKQFWEQCLLASYNSLRQEILALFNSILALVSAAAAAVGALASFALSSSDPTFKIGVFLGIIPITTYLAAALWANLNAMMLRAGNYLVVLEEQITLALPRSPTPLFWERFVRSNDPRVVKARFWETTLAIIFVPALASIWYGSYLLNAGGIVRLSIGFGETVIWATMMIFFWRFVVRRWETSCVPASLNTTAQ